MDLVDSISLPHPRYNPSATELLSCKGVIKGISEEISSIESQIRELTARIASLQRKRDNYMSYISPFRRLPSEILTEIVTICLDCDVRLTTVTQICGTARDVVIGMSSLWSKIALLPSGRYVYSPSLGIFCTTKERLDLVLKRAGAAPLTVYFDTDAKNLLSMISSDRPIRLLNIRLSDPGGGFTSHTQATQLERT
ncbi:hypothetical protein CPB86DRAFT_58179 [Serendipita vermifera]|nr:hypothetical protein CPB86DRAFT_58179 [Serendipita vermifera]